MISKTKIKERAVRKTNEHLAEAIFLARKAGLMEIARALSSPARKRASVNVRKLNILKAETAIVPGKVLGSGNIDKKMKIYAIGFSKEASKKLKKAGCECELIFEALKKLKKGEKIKGEIIR